jgi:hypothetical protein
MLRFMRAHGQTPGPGQRPRAAGALAGLLGGIAALPILEWSQAITLLTDAVHLPGWTIRALYVALVTLGGVIYGAVFGRAASDRRGGWLFGISYGFLLWMLGPTTILQTIAGRPLVTGTAAIGVLGAQLLSGLMLGLLFRPMQDVARKRLPRAVAGHVQATTTALRGIPPRFPQTRRDI